MPGGEPVFVRTMELEIKRINKRYGAMEVLTDVSFSLRSGERIAIAGGNGCGKSTLLAILAGTLPGSGQFLCDGVDLFTHPRERSRLVGYLPQTPPLFEELTARDHLRLYFGAKGMRRALDGGVASLLGVDAFLRTPVRKMSGGMKKRLAVACAVAHQPRILLLDEAGAALDPACRQSIYDYLDSFCADGGAVISITHDTEELTNADRGYFLRDGVLIPAEAHK